MREQHSAWLVRDIRVPFDAPDEQAIEIAKTRMKRAGVAPSGLHFRIYKKSHDARRRGQILTVITVLVTAKEGIALSSDALTRAGATPYAHARPEWVCGSEVLSAPPVVVGMGPAGLFAALAMAENGYAPIIIDRGDDVTARAAATERFARFGVLDTESNIQFGAGGAGTFSDGKLVTRVNDPLCNYVLERLCEFGAPEEVQIKAKPHVGTDILRVVVDNILSRIEALGGKVCYRTCLTDVTERADGLVLHTTKGDILTPVALLAIGHSARDTFDMLMRRGYSLAVKPFSVGVRIEHLRVDIDRALYGDAAGHPALGPAEYTLSDTTARGVYTFCMCPGGEVVAASSETDAVVVNGMSYHARNGANSNAAIAVTVTPDDVGGSVEGAIAFQRDIERAAYRAGGGDYVAPVQTVGDFLGGTVGSAPTRVKPTYGGGRVRTADLHDVLPAFVCEELARGIVSFDRRIAGYAAPDAVLTGAETRTSSPVRILRGEERYALAHPRIYPAGEGAGYAGGITSAALDGLRSAMAIMARYAPLN